MTVAPELSPLAAARPAPAARRLVAIPAAPAEAAGYDFDTALADAALRLRRFVQRRLFDAADTDEVVQEALLRACERRELFATPDDLNAWLTVVAARLVVDRIRGRSRVTPVADFDAAARTGRDTAEVVVARDEARLALDALAALPTRQAAVLWAREVEGLPYEDIAHRHSLSEATVRSLLHRARRSLRREYAVRGGTLPTAGILGLSPWLLALRRAGRLHHALRRLGPCGYAAPMAALAVVGAISAVVAGLPAGSGAGARPALPISAPMLRLSSGLVPALPAGARAPRRPEAVAGSPSAAQGHAPALEPITHDLATTHACSPLPGGAVGLNCGHPATSVTLLPALPANPLAVRQVGAEQNLLPCAVGTCPTGTEPR